MLELSTYRLASVSNIIIDPNQLKEALESKETQEELKDRLNARKFKLLENLLSQQKDDRMKLFFCINYRGIKANILFTS